MLYLNIPRFPRELNTLREIIVTTNRDHLIAKTTQFVRFSRNRNASVFVCASGAKASPYIMFLLRVGRELTLCEHRASDASHVTTAFSPDSRWIFFESDGEGSRHLRDGGERSRGADRFRQSLVLATCVEVPGLDEPHS